MNHPVKEIFAHNKIYVTDIKGVSGGDISAAYVAHSDTGKHFIKINAADNYPEMFAREAEGLDTLRNNTTLAVPGVISSGVFNNSQYLILEHLEKANPSKTFWTDFALGLARLHSNSRPAFGLHVNNYIGSLKQDNTPSNDWPSFYTNRRILPLVARLADEKIFTSSDLSAAENFCKKLDEIFPEEPPALLHGDLWSGNFMAVTNLSNPAKENTGLPCIYDPAIYYGHREMDIGMTLLFGGFDRRLYEEYNEIFPLERNWQKRVSVTQLYPLLVHAILFGGSYVLRCRSILKNWT